jgi:hypothetical protein
MVSEKGDADSPSEEWVGSLAVKIKESVGTPSISIDVFRRVAASATSSLRVA